MPLECPVSPVQRENYFSNREYLAPKTRCTGLTGHSRGYPKLPVFRLRYATLVLARYLQTRVRGDNNVLRWLVWG